MDKNNDNRTDNADRLSRNHFIKSLEQLDVKTTNILLNKLGSNIEISEFVDKSLFKDSQEYCGNLGLSKDNKFINIIYVLDEPSEEEIKSYIDFQVIISNSLNRDKLKNGKDVSQFETVIVTCDPVEEDIRCVTLYGRDFSIHQYSFISNINDDTSELISKRLEEISSSLTQEERIKFFLKGMIGDGDVADEFIERLKNNDFEKDEGSGFERTLEFTSKKGGNVRFSIREATEEDLKRHNIDPKDFENSIYD